MRNWKKLAIGDQIEVRQITPRGEVWQDAKVTYHDRYSVAAEFADGTRVAFLGKLNVWRWPTPGRIGDQG